MSGLYPHSLIYIGLIGMVTALSGTVTGIVLSYIIIGNGQKLRGILLGVLGGFMFSMVLFDFLPESYTTGNWTSLLMGLLVGLVFIYLFDRALHNTHIGHHPDAEKRFLKSAIVLSVGIGLHNIPSGVALGALLYVSLRSSIPLIIALVLHGIPESIALGVFFKECRIKKRTVFVISLLISLPMGIGSLLGGIVSKLFPYILSASIAFAAGLILYIILSEIFPEAKRLRTSLSFIFESTVGFIIGIVFSILLH